MGEQRDFFLSEMPHWGEFGPEVLARRDVNLPRANAHRSIQIDVALGVVNPRLARAPHYISFAVNLSGRPCRLPAVLCDHVALCHIPEFPASSLGQPLRL